MKIECEICQTVFIIDDSLISDKGIKAQCPRCGHQTVVRRQPSEDLQGPADPLGQHVDSSLFTGAAPAFTSGSFSPMGGLGSSTGALSSYEENPYNSGIETGYSGEFGGELACFKCGKPIHENSDSVLPVCDECQVGAVQYEEQHVQEDLPTMANIPNSPMSSGLEPLSYGHEMTEEPYEPFGEQTSAAPDYIPMNSLPPVQSESFSPMGGHIDDPMEGEGRLDPTWLKVRRISDGQEVGPLSLAEVRSLYVHGKLSFEDEYSGRDGVWHPIHQVPELLVILRRTPQLSSGEGEPAPRGNRGQGIVLWLLALLLLFGGGGTGWLIWYNWYNASKHKHKHVTQRKRVTAPSRLLAEKIKQWKQQHSDVQASAKKSQLWSQQGWSALALDQPEAYSQAIRSFTRALVADSKNLRALAGYCLATLWSPSAQDASARKQSECGSIMKRQFKRRKTAIMRSVYALYLARRGSNNKARRYAHKAARQNKKEAWSLLIQAELWISQQYKLKRVEKLLESALKKQSNLARVRLRLAKFQMAEMKYYHAQKNLTQLVEKGHPTGLYLSAQLYHALGQHRKAASILETLMAKNATHLKGWLMLALLRYQFLRQYNKAYKQLLKAPVLGPGQTLPKVLRKKRLLHLTYIALAMNKTKEAKKHIQQLRKWSKSFLPARFLEVQWLVYNKKYKRAADRFVVLQGRLSSPHYQSYYTLLLMLEGKYKEAAKKIRPLLDEYSYFVWPRLLLPAAYFKLKKKDLGLVVLKKALDVEPQAIRNTQKCSDFFFLPQPWLYIKRIFTSQKVSREERALTTSAAGLVAYHLHRQGEARSLFRRSRGIDRNGLASNLYLAQIAYERKNYRQAKRYARRVYQNYNQHTVSTLILARVAYTKKKYKDAQKLFHIVRRERPWFLSAKIGKALTLGALGERKEGLHILQQIQTSQTTHHLLARALYRLKW